MKTNKLWKRFWTLNVHDHAGFTLVELIVVIAILAILAAVAVPAYSGYIEKTNKTLDVTLAGEVKHALELAYYSRDIESSGFVVLPLEGEEPVYSSDEYEDAILAAFGNAGALTLKHDGWNGEYDGSSFQNVEAPVLLGKVDGLTTSLANFFSNNTSVISGTDSFKGYAAGLLGTTADKVAEEDPQVVANAAALYVADQTAGYRNNATVMSAINSIGKNEIEGGAALDSMQNAASTVMNLYGGNLLLGSAATYAMMTGFVEYSKLSGLPANVGSIDSTLIDENADAQDMLNLLADSFGPVFEHDDFDAKWNEYIKEQASKDILAYMDVMGTVSGAKDQVDVEDTQTCFNNPKIQQLLTSYSGGGIVVFLEVDQSTGTIKTSTAPEMN